MAGNEKNGKSRSRRWLSLLIFLAILPLAGWAWYVWGGGNFHVVAEGKLYRCSQPKPDRLKKLVQDHHIRTVINLRGCCDPVEWYRNEARATQELAISLEDIPFSAMRLPPPVSLAHLVQLFDEAEEPLLIHCHQGIDRTGMACALWQLLKTDTPLEVAAKQLGPFYGHFPVGRTWWLDEFLDMYRSWLTENGWTHRPELLREWLTKHYCPGPMRAEMTWLATPAPRVELGKSVTARVRCQNNSHQDWQMLPALNAGIHLIWRVQDDKRQVVVNGYAGLFEKVVRPGESVELTLAIPALEKAGTMVLRAGLEDPQHGTFAQLGNDILETTFEVVESAKAAE